MKGKIYSSLWAISAAALTVPGMAMAQIDKGISQAQNSGLGKDDVITVLQKVLNYLLAAVGVLGVLAFVIAGIFYLTAAGDEDRIKIAKTALTYAVVGIVVSVIGLIVVSSVAGLLGAGGGGSTQ